MAKELSLLAVQPHPDDESIGMGGALARYSAEGVRTTLVTATRGEVGEILDKDLDPKAEEFIVGWAKELPRDATLALVVISTGRPDYPTRLRCCATRFTSSSVNALKHIGGVCANCSVWAGPAW